MGEFSLLSLNIFGIPFFLGWERLRRLARVLDRSTATVICLQEVQQHAYTSMIQRNLPSYPYHFSERHIYAPKGGLAMYSRLPLVGPRFEVYQERGVFLSIGYSDYALYKGILSACFEVGEQTIIVLTTHLNANYGGVWHPTNPLALLERYQVKQLVRAIHACPEEALVIACGDLNFPRNSFLYEELVTQNNLLDPLANDPRPSYRPFPLVPAKWNVSLDYVLVRQPLQKNFQIRGDVVEISDSAKKFSIQRFLTDHNALTLHVSWDDSPDPKGEQGEQTQD